MVALLAVVLLLAAAAMAACALEMDTGVTNVWSNDVETWALGTVGATRFLATWGADARSIFTSGAFPSGKYPSGWGQKTRVKFAPRVT